MSPHRESMDRIATESDEGDRWLRAGARSCAPGGQPFTQSGPDRMGGTRMKSPIAALIMAGTLVGAANAQNTIPGQVGMPAGTQRQAPAGPRRLFGVNPLTGQPKEQPPTRDLNVGTAASFEPVPFDQIKPPTVDLPNDPIEPFLLTKDIGPFMVLAKTFRGPDAEKFALALVQELRSEFGLPAYILRTKDFANRSLVRNIPPTAPANLQRPLLTEPEKYRTYDESAVLVGNEKTLEASEKLLHEVKKLKPRCLDELPHIWNNRRHLKNAIRTTNPFVPAQDLFPGKIDRMVTQMNQGPHSIFNCPGRYSLEVATYTGRSTFNVDAGKMEDIKILKKSPLMTAMDDAENLAAALAKTDEVRKTGQPVFVYHDLHSSRVFVGAFNSPNDAAAVRLREYLVQQSAMMADWRDNHGKPLPGHNRGIKTLIAPATFLTDLEDPQRPIKRVSYTPTRGNR